MMHFIRRPLVIGLALVLAVTLGCGGGAGGANSRDEDVAVELIVKSTLPTNMQEVLPQLTDPGLGGVIQVRFSERVLESTIIDNTNAFNGLTSDVNILNSAFERVSGTPSITGEARNILTFVPAGGTLDNGQYTITVTRDVKNFQGGRLNGGRFDYRSSFTVGADQYKPVIRNTFPAPNQNDVPLASQIIITFNESLDPGTVTTNNITLFDTAQVPAVQVTGQVSLARDNFEAVFTPDGTGMPPNARIEVTVQGGAGGIADHLGNEFAGDPATPGVYQFRFNTITRPPLPNNPTPLYVPLVSNPLALYYANGQQVGVIDESSFVAGGFVDLSDWAYVNQNSTPPILNPVPNSLTKIGKPSEILVDPRADANGHSYIYIVDQASGSIAIMRSQDSIIMHRWKELPDPQGIAIEPGGFNFWATNGSSDTISLFDMTGMLAPNATGALQALKDVPSSRQDFQVGRGPGGIAPLLSKTSVMVVNRVGNSVTELNTADGSIVDTLQVNESPWDVACSNFVVLGLTPIGHFAWISCQGGGDDANGSVALWWEDWLPLGINSGKGRIQSLLGGFKNPKGLQYDYGTSGGGFRACWVANSGGNTVAQMALNVSGAGLATTILPSITANVTVGNNPTDVAIDPMRATFGNPPIICTADLGSGQISFVDSLRLTAPKFALKIPGVRVVDCWLSQ